MVATIRSTSETSAGSYGGGGSIAPPTFTPSPQYNPNTNDPFGATSQNAVQVIIANNVGFDDATMDKIISGIREATDGRDVILFGPDSRQAKDIVST
jgi:hypothetical protein